LDSLGGFLAPPVLHIPKSLGLVEFIS